ncbi:MAG: trigger factor [Rhizobiaceae bacterium]|nr:trigger factor [Rhizobiaceae bacterium]
MQVTETLNTGLKREIKVIVPKDDMAERLNRRLADAKDRVQIRGFRPGKVPLAHLKKMYGKSFMAEVVNEIINDSPRSVLSDRGEKAAMQPEIKMTEDEKEAESILNGNADLEFSMSYEVIPAIELKDYSGIAVTRLLYDVPADEVEKQVAVVADSARTYEPKKGKAETGDKVTIDYLGKIDGEAFEGGAADDADLVIGSNQFIPGFEDQLVGVKAGEEKVIEVTFPEGYPAQHLAGRAATFDIKVKQVQKPGDLVIDDELAKTLGMESAERLREVVKSQIESQYGAVTRQKVKRQILDALDEQYRFDAPAKLVETEFDNIWNQVNRDLQQAGKTFADEDTTEEEARAEYQRLAERRVRLGLVLAEIGEKAGVTVSDDELQRGLYEQIRRFPASQQQEAFNFYRDNPSALAGIRAPLYEEKVIDHLLGQISVTDKQVGREELLADDAEEGASEETKPAKKKAAPKKKAAKADAEE